jgi:hypothetical protein
VSDTLFDSQLRVRFADPDTSVAAASSIRPALGAECSRVLAEVVERGNHGATAYEVVQALRSHGIDRDQNCVARRCTDLRDAGLLVDTTERRPGKSGRQLIVWQAVQS